MTTIPAGFTRYSGSRVPRVEDPRLLRGQMQAYVACDDPEVREAVRRGFGRIVAFIESKGASSGAAAECIARGMLFNDMVLMGLFDADLPWAKRLIAGASGEA